MIATITLPMPPSVNTAYCNGNKGRFKSSKYKEWEALCATYKNKGYSYEKERGKVLYVEYTFFTKWLNKDGSIKVKDLSNYFKCLDDYIPHIMDGFDDSLIWHVDAKKVHSDRNEVEIIIKEINK